MNKSYVLVFNTLQKRKWNYLHQIKIIVKQRLLGGIDLNTMR